ncbi:MAG: hypothetical protein U1E97_06660 [Alphaproteobacteria bacterium]
MPSIPPPSQSPDPRAELTRLGTALFGPRWQSSLARAIGVSDRTVRHWVAGSRPVPPDAIARARECLIEDRVARALAAIDELAAQTGQPAEIRLAAQADPDAQAVTERVADGLRARGIAVVIVPADPAETDPAKRADPAAAGVMDR